MKGLKIGGTFGPTADLVKTAGGTPVNVPLPDLYMSLQTKVIDQGFASWSGAKNYKLWEVTKFSTELNFFRTANMILFNKDTWNSLSADQQKIFMSLVPGAIDRGADGIITNSGVGKKSTMDNGNTIYTPTSADFATWTTNIQSVEDKWLADMKAKGLTSAPQVLARLKQLSAQATAAK